MTNEELQRRMNETPPFQPHHDVAPAVPVVPPEWASPSPEERAAAADKQRQAHAASVAAARDALASRLHPKLKRELERCQTPCALFLGPTGCGKTSGALWLIAAAPRAKTLFARARDLANANRRHPLGQGAPPAITAACDTTYLVIDDVGSEGPDASAIQEVLDSRYSRQAPTIVTSGLTYAELDAHLGPAYMRRLAQQHACQRSGVEFPVLMVDCHE